MNHQMFAIHILLCQDVSGMLHNDAKLTKGKICQYLLRSQAHWPFRWHHGGLFNVKVERHSIHGDFGREIGNEGPIERATADGCSHIVDHWWGSSITENLLVSSRRTRASF